MVHYIYTILGNIFSNIGTDGSLHIFNPWKGRYLLSLVDSEMCSAAALRDATAKLLKEICSLLESTIYNVLWSEARGELGFVIITI